MTVQFGIFDHLTGPPGVPLHRLYADRIALLQKAERAGFYGYHVAEHHGHELGMAPSQAVFLAALARETERLRLGPMVCCLPLHHPLRVVEEACMLDHLSGGRLDLGVGRGISAFEHRLFGHDAAEAPARFRESLDMVVQGLATGRIDGSARRFFDFPEVAVSMRPLQEPYPPLWYAGNSTFAAEHGFNFIGPRITAAGRRRFGELWEQGREGAGRVNPHVGSPLIGSSQFLCVADTDDAARRIGRRAAGVLSSLLEKTESPLPRHLSGPNADDVLVCGSPETVREYFCRYVAEGNVNYLVVALPFGDMTTEEANRSLDLFIEEVMPAVRALPAGAPGGVPTLSS
jgi:alkanesulfonate monooxygenase SsuD/methylene tetrahydromethanopterin reductase-like flavin-dependent oxidoreductase (luciferase family)